MPLSYENTSDPTIVVSALYHFVALDEPARFKPPILEYLLEREIRGTLLLAREGINGTLAGSAKHMSNMLAWLKSFPEFKDLTSKESTTQRPPFKRTRVKLKREIVTMGMPDIDPRLSAGTYVEPHEWNALIEDPEVLVIDTRNDYEVNVGSFKGAVNPETKSFREFPSYVDNHLDKRRHKKVAMFCTGGIRCEKSTSYLRQQGFEEVYHLKGGILKYLETVPESESTWQGECFVFDDRVTVNHNLEPGQYDQCHACRRPITDEDKASAHYQPGASCPHCVGEISPSQKERFLEREKQMLLAKSRGEAHIGADAAAQLAAKRKTSKPSS